MYFSSASENTARFIESCQLSGIGIAVYRIPLKPGSAPLNVREPYVLMVPTYGGGDAKKAVPPQVKRFLNNPANRAWIRGVVASGNTNFAPHTARQVTSSPRNAACRSSTVSSLWARAKTRARCAMDSCASSGTTAAERATITVIPVTPRENYTHD